MVTTHLYDGRKSFPLDIELYQHASSLREGKQDSEFEKKPELALKLAVLGESIGDAPFGLTNFDSRTYGRFEERPTQIFSTFDADPSVFGIEGNLRSDRYFGGSNELFGRASDSAVIDLVQQTIVGDGIINVTDGTGIFENATGLITFTQKYRLTPGSTDRPLTSAQRTYCPNGHFISWISFK